MVGAALADGHENIGKMTRASHVVILSIVMIVIKRFAMRGECADQGLTHDQPSMGLTVFLMLRSREERKEAL